MGIKLPWAAAQNKRKKRNQQTKEADPFYNQTRWRKARKSYIASHPWCEVSDYHGRMVDGRVVDHVIPISMGGAKYDPRNFMTMSDAVHNLKRGKEAHGWSIESVRTDHGLIPKDRNDLYEALKSGVGR